ncbi:P-loop containing nucleoside triphosphate hydrolase protein, partial [Daedaleopsis nitida]
MSGGPPGFKWSSDEGRRLARSTLSQCLPYDPHDYQLEGVCKLMDGTDLLAVIATGSGKTGYFTMYMLLQLALSKDPSLCEPPWTRTPQNPCMVIVYPTIGLEEEMAGTFDTLKLKPLVINSRTLQAARGKRPTLWEAAAKDPHIILLSPELLCSRDFEGLLQQPLFQRRICALGIDEVHLLNSWGAGFRKDFQQLGFARARMPGGVRLVCTTASLLHGKPKKTVCDLLGLYPNYHYFLQRSNIRPELQLLFRPLSHGLGGWAFPDFRWVLDGRRKTVFYCRTIVLSFRLLCYLRKLCPASDHPEIRIRMYNSLMWAKYNEKTRDLMRNDSRAQIIVATASFMVGVDLPNIHDVILTQQPDSADEWVQWGGRAGRDPTVVRDARVITYYTKKAPELAHAVAEASSAGPQLQGEKRLKPTMDVSIAQLIIAPCKVAAQNDLYHNPPADSPCSCRSCAARTAPNLPYHCDCSGCTPEPTIPAGMSAPPKKPMNPI